MVVEVSGGTEEQQKKKKKHRGTKRNETKTPNVIGGRRNRGRHSMVVIGP